MHEYLCGELTLVTTRQTEIISMTFKYKTQNFLEDAKPNPRLMNVSLLRDSKLLHGPERRGSRASVRGPSRQPSIASLRPQSPQSLGKKFILMSE